MFLYNLILSAYGLAIRIASLRSPKAAQWVAGRKNWRRQLASKTAGLKPGKRIWVHCASYGEFEQGRPLMEAMRLQHPADVIVLSFFSPSGYEAFKEWKGADLICYLPLDTKRNGRDFLELIQPDTAVFIKYEFWVNFLFQLRRRSIPSFLVSAVFKPHHPFFKWYGQFFRRSLLTFNKLFVQDKQSATLLQSIGITNYEISGDTRFDRVLEIKQRFLPLPFFDAFCKDNSIWVAGSTWPGDEELVIRAFKKLERPDLKLIIAPHQVDERSVAALVQLLEKNDLPCTLYSEGQGDPSGRVLVLDAMGLLSNLYYYADVVYVGGGFDSGIHNCLEPTVYLKPVVFYDHAYQKYNEVVDLVELQVAKPVGGVEELEKEVRHFLDDTAARKVIEAKLQLYFEKNSGSTQKVLSSMNLAG